MWAVCGNPVAAGRYTILNGRGAMGFVKQITAGRVVNPPAGSSSVELT
jgi:hypothetical protein